MGKGLKDSVSRILGTTHSLEQVTSPFFDFHFFTPKKSVTNITFTFSLEQMFFSDNAPNIVGKSQNTEFQDCMEGVEDKDWEEEE